MSPLVIPISVDGHILKTEVAAHPTERSQGLMYRHQLGWNSGMLFVYENSTYLNFWMENTLIPLSIAFISDNGHIVRTEDMEPQSTLIHRSPCPVRYALEVNHGWFAKRDIGTNSVVQFTFPANQ